MIYLDYAATTPISKQALQIYEQVSQSFFANPSSLHDCGTKTHHLLEQSRKTLAKLLLVNETGIYFTGSGSEANILALRSLIDAHQHRGKHLITTETEHASVYHFFRSLEEEGFEITRLPLNEVGQVQLEDVRKAIKETTILASIHYGNGEIGTIQPMEEIGSLLAEYDILFHSDCVQAFGKVPLEVDKVKLDSISVSGHKIYGPKGVGAAYINPKVRWQPMFPGTSHESGFRPGTENVPGIAAFVTAAELICGSLNQEADRLNNLKKSLINELAASSDYIQFEGDLENSLPQILGLRIIGMEGQLTMLECNRHGIAIATGSACQTGKQLPSRTMVSIGRSEIEAKQFIRLSFGKQTTIDEINKTVAVLRKVTANVFC